MHNPSLYFAEGLSDLFLFAQKYNGGINSRAKSKVLASPPMITVANGRWTSEPMPLEVAAGTSPRMAKTRMDKMAGNCSFDTWLTSPGVNRR